MDFLITRKSIGLREEGSTLSDPINDTFRLEAEEFTEQVVREYLSNKARFTRYPSRHYSQLELKFEREGIKSLLRRLDLPASGTTVLVFGGYTGEF